MRLSGAVQKGPFVVGSSVAVSLLDDRLTPTGSVFQTQTRNDRGEFDISFTASGPVSLEGQGFYFNEVFGTLSQAPLTLRAFYAPSQAEGQKVFVNMVTHLTAERIKALVSQGSSFPAAVQQAEGELLRQLQITSADYQPAVAGVSMDVTGGDTRDNAYLLGVSSVLIQVAVLHQSGSLDAALQETLNAYTLDLADDGTLDPERRDDIAAALAQLQVDAVQVNLARRLAELGSSDPVPDMRQAMDVTRCCQQGKAFESCRSADGLPSCDAGLACGSSQECGGADSCCLPAGGMGQPCQEAFSDPQCTVPGCPIVSVCDAGLACQVPDVGPLANVCLPGGGLGQGCLAGGTCEAGLVCRTGLFSASASTSAACRYGECCQTPGGPACSPSMPCPEGSACTSGFCEPSCDALQCPTGSSCFLTPQDPGVVAAVCSPVGCDEDSDCPAGSVCDGVACKPPGSSPDPSSPATGGAGQPCSPGNVCDAPLVCRAHPSCVPAAFCCLVDDVPPTGGLEQRCLGDSAVEDLYCNPGLRCYFDDACAPYGLLDCCLPEHADAGVPDAAP